MPAQWRRGSSLDTPAVQKARIQAEEITNGVFHCAPERSLIAGVIHRAFCDALSKDISIAAGALRWFQSRSVEGRSFFWCLDLLGMSRRTQKDFLERIEYWKAAGVSPQRKVANKKPNGSDS